MKAIDLVGRMFGRLQVVARAGSTDRTPARPLWRCRCACGNEPIVLAAYLLAGRTQSCGCLRAERARASIAATRAQRRRRRPRAVANRSVAELDVPAAGDGARAGRRRGQAARRGP
jgi:hypothetical protein